MAPKPKAKPASVVAGSRRRSRRVVEPGRVPTNGEGMGRSEGRVPGPRNGPPAPGEGIGHPEGRVPGPRNGPPAPKGPPPPTPVNLPAAKGPPQLRPVNPGDIGPMEFAFGDRVVASHLAPFPAPAGPSREEFLVARAVKEDLGLRDETPIMVRFDPDSEAVMAADIVLITVERITPEDMNRRGLAWRHCAFVFDGPENPPPPLVETPPLENGYHCRPNTNSITAGAEGRVPGGEGGAEGRVPGSGGGGEGRVPAGEGRVPVGCWVGTVRDGPDFDMGVFASDNEEEPPVCEVRGGVGFRHGDPRLGFLGMSSDSDAILDGEDAESEAPSNDAVVMDCYSESAVDMDTNHSSDQHAGREEGRGSRMGPIRRGRRYVAQLLSSDSPRT